MAKFVLLSFIASLFVSGTSQALPLPKNQQLFATELPLTFTESFDFEGIVGLNNCSGSLIMLENAKDTDMGLILTNGHCLEGGMPAPGTHVYGKASRRTFNLYNSRAQVVARLTADKIVYATMTKTDMAIYRVTESYRDIKSKYGIRPLTLQSQKAKVGEKIEVISGYWKRGYSCSIEKFITQLKEDKWTWDDSIRYSRPGCEVIGGTSGSPVVLAGSRSVIGVNNTGNDAGEKCTMDNPCEVDENGNITYTKGFSYGQQTYLLYSCLNSNSEVDITLKGCMLPH